MLTPRFEAPRNQARCVKCGMPAELTQTDLPRGSLVIMNVTEMATLSATFDQEGSSFLTVRV